MPPGCSRNFSPNWLLAGMVTMSKINARMAGVELYFDNLPVAKHFYEEVLGLRLVEEQTGHHARFDGGAAFICVEAKGAEDYPSLDKAVIFLEVPDLRTAIDAIGEHRILKQQSGVNGRPTWAVLHDPEGHNILLLERGHLTRD
jgi:predicted enzyme related to lactoylglutathione lyase